MIWRPLASPASQVLVVAGWASVFWLAPLGGIANVQVAAWDLGWRISAPLVPISVVIVALVALRRVAGGLPATWVRVALLSAGLGNLGLMLYSVLSHRLQLTPVWWLWLAADGIAFLAASRFTPLAWQAGVWGLGAMGVVQVLFVDVICVHPAACTRSSVVTATVAELVVEGYGGFNIIRQFGEYFAVEQSAGTFSHDVFVRGQYRPGFQAATLTDIELQIDAYAGRPTLTPEELAPRLLETDGQGAHYLAYQGRLFAVPPVDGAVDAERFVNGGYADVVTGASLEEVHARVAEIRATYLEPGEFDLEEGFYASEGPSGAPFPRWSGARAALNFLPRGSGEVVLSAVVVQPQVRDAPIPDLTLVLDGAPIRQEHWGVVQVDPGRFAISVPLDRERHGSTPSQLLLLSPTFVPSQQPWPSTDSRELGISIESIALTEGGEANRFRDRPIRRPVSGGATQIAPRLDIWRNP